MASASSSQTRPSWPPPRNRADAASAEEKNNASTPLRNDRAWMICGLESSSTGGNPASRDRKSSRSPTASANRVRSISTNKVCRASATASRRALARIHSKLVDVHHGQIVQGVPETMPESGRLKEPERAQGQCFRHLMMTGVGLEGSRG